MCILSMRSTALQTCKIACVTVGGWTSSDDAQPKVVLRHDSLDACYGQTSKEGVCTARATFSCPPMICMIFNQAV